MEKELLLTIVMPFYHAEETLGTTLESLKELIPDEDFRFEVVLAVDGCEPPKDISGLAGPLDLRVVTLPHQGVLATRLAGVRSSEARYVYFLDCDDSLSRSFFAELSDAARCTDFDVALVRISFEGSDARVQPSFPEPIGDAKFCKWLAGTGDIGYVASKVYRRTLFTEEVFASSKDYPYGFAEDLFISLRLFRGGLTYVALPSPGYRYAQSSGSAAHALTYDKMHGYIQLLSERHRFVLENGKGYPESEYLVDIQPSLVELRKSILRHGNRGEKRKLRRELRGLSYYKAAIRAQANGRLTLANRLFLFAMRLGF